MRQVRQRFGKGFAASQVQRLELGQLCNGLRKLFEFRAPIQIQHIISERAISKHLHCLGQRGEPSHHPDFGSTRSIVYVYALQAREEVRQVRQRFGKVFAAVQVQRLELGQLCNGLRQLFEFRALNQIQHFEVDQPCHTRFRQRLKVVAGLQVQRFQVRQLAKRVWQSCNIGPSEV